MPSFGFHARLAIALLVVYAAFWTWQTPGWLRGPLTAAEIDHHIGLIEKNLAMPAEEKPAILARIRAWAEADDGRPVYMLNLMRYYPELRRFEGTPDFDGTPEESNAYYEKSVVPLALARGDYPLFVGNVSWRNLIEHAPALDDWSRVILMRYPSRRAVLELFGAPAYAPYEPYKLMALQLMLTPVRAETLVPELRWMAGAALVSIFLAIGWLRAARRSRP